MFLLELIFWLSGALVVYAFGFYKPMLSLLCRLCPTTDYASYRREDEDLPSVTMIISAFNEAAVIEEKLQNAVAIDYPADKFQVVVISDASDDGTDELVTALAGTLAATQPQINLHRQQQRLGKTAGINTAIENIESQLVVFSDANAMYESNAVYELVKYFKDTRVGYVVGAALYNVEEKNLANASESEYWDSELAIKAMEAKISSVVGGDGAIYGIRRELYQPLEQDDINDFANPLQIVAAGHRGAFNGDAICYEDSAESFDKEYKRKRRIVNRSFRALSRYLPRFNLREHKLFLFLLFSHKVFRWFSGVFILACCASALILSATGAGWVYTLGLLGILGTMVLALVGKRVSEQGESSNPLTMLYYFYLVNLGAVLGIVDNIRGKRHVTWDHIRKSNQ